MAESEESIAAPPNEDQHRTQLVEDVFSMFKGYLSSQLEAKDKSTENKAKMLQEANDLKFKGNRKQYEMNAHISYIFNQIEANIDNPAEIKKLIEAEQQSIKKRQKLIRLADRSKDGWQVVHEYESDELASDSDDEKRIRKARNAVEKKRKDVKASSDSGAKRFKSSNDNQLFRGTIVRVLCLSHGLDCVSIQPYLRLLCISL